MARQSSICTSIGNVPGIGCFNTAENALAMGLATAFVLLMSNILVSLLRNFVPKQVRIASYILIIATFVTVTDYAIQAISVELHKSLGAFISLIVVNCLILSRAEAFASKILLVNLFLMPWAWGWDLHLHFLSRCRQRNTWERVHL